MLVVNNIQDLREELLLARTEKKTIGFTPTMGALHEGHIALARRAKQENDVSVMSIFVNPAQFSPTEDFQRYPRKVEQDQALARAAGVDIFFIPEVADVYPDGFSTYAEETKISTCLCGAYRPGHFRGVCTVVLKLFAMVAPDRSYFGQKDAQQLRIIEKMVEDLNLTVEVVACPTVREKDGLAMSSRNIYLTTEERAEAPVIHETLSEVQTLFQQGERRADRLLSIAQKRLAAAELFQVQYMEIRRWRDFEPVSKILEKSFLAVAGFYSNARLIDNVLLVP